MITSRFLAFGIATALTITSFSATASAAETTVPTKAVNYADLNLASAAGRATLDRRIARAVDTVCQPVLDNASSSTEGRVAYNKCRAETFARVHSQVAALPTPLRFASH